MSAITPPALVRGEEPKAPAKKRKMTRVWMFCDAAAPALKAVSAPYVMKNKIWRPYSSDRGAHSNGPMAKPSTKSETPNVTTSWLAPNCRMICSTPPVYAEETKATARVAKATSRVMDHFLSMEKPMGFRGSLGIKSTTYGSSSVPAPSYWCLRTAEVTRECEATMRQCGGL